MDTKLKEIDFFIDQAIERIGNNTEYENLQKAKNKLYQIKLILSELKINIDINKNSQ